MAATQYWRTIYKRNSVPTSHWRKCILYAYSFLALYSTIDADGGRNLHQNMPFKPITASNLIGPPKNWVYLYDESILEGRLDVFYWFIIVYETTLPESQPLGWQPKWRISQTISNAWIYSECQALSRDSISKPLLKREMSQTHTSHRP